jgi:hypothetical protein
MERQNQLRRAIEIRKKYIIKKLVIMDVYKATDIPELHELTLSELEQEWKLYSEKKSEDGAG